MKKINFLILLLFVTLFPILFGCGKGANYTVPNAFITIDINPSIEIITGKDGLVEEVSALNEDAEILLVGTDFTGKSVEEVSEAIVELANELGYIDSEQDNALIITAEAENADETEELETKLEQRIKRFARRKAIRLAVIKARLAASEELKQQAEELGISVGKLKLISFAMSLDEDLVLEEAADMSVRELLAIIKAARKEYKLYKDELKDTYFDIKEELKIKFFQARVQAINTYLQEATVEDLENFVNEQIDAETIKAIYQNYANEVAAFTPAEDETPANLEDLLAQKEQIREQLKNLLERINGLLSSEDRETLRNLKEQFKEIETEIKEAMGNAYKNIKEYFRFKYGDFIFENRPRYQNYRDLRKIRSKYVAEFNNFGINLDELEEFVAEKIADQIEDLMETYEQQFEEKKTELQDQAQEYKEYLRKENQVLREANKEKKSK